jgi:hypothetical protein
MVIAIVRLTATVIARFMLASPLMVSADGVGVHRPRGPTCWI